MGSFRLDRVVPFYKIRNSSHDSRGAYGLYHLAHQFFDRFVERVVLIVSK